MSNSIPETVWSGTTTTKIVRELRYIDAGSDGEGLGALLGAADGRVGVSVGTAVGKRVGEGLGK